MQYQIISNKELRFFCKLVESDSANARRPIAKEFCAQKSVKRTTPGSINLQTPDFKDLEIIAKRIVMQLSDPKMESATTKIREQYEADLCADVYLAIKNFPYEALDDGTFWQYLAVQYFSEFIVWRESSALTKGNIFTYFNATRVDCIPLRLYLRAQTIFEATSNFDLVAAIPESTDFWRSHILRVRTGLARPVASTFAQMQRDDRMPTEPLRALAKLINRMWSNVSLFEYDAKSAKKLLKELQKRMRSESD